jgi:molecular chaperone DnaK (HSP70)
VSRAVLGIDLGTTNSVVASIDDNGRPAVLRNAAGAETTPSVVYFEPDGTAVVGEYARQAVAADPANGVALVKRQMGTDFPLEIRGERHTPESISALILRQLVAGAGAPDARVVITVPAYFGLREREATHQAGVLAGLDVLELVAEPVAAAAHYGLTAERDATVLVYDLGGGTFDTTVLRVHSAGIDVVATDGHHELGGADVDRRLLRTVLDRLRDLLSPGEFADVCDDEVLLGTLLLDVEAAKRDLSARRSRDVPVRALGRRLTVSLTREDVDGACTDLLETTEDIVRRVLRTAGASGYSRIDQVVMVGGSSRIPAVLDRLRQATGVTPRLVEPDLAVAKGAALRAHQLARTTQLRALAGSGRRAGLLAGGRIRSVVPRGIGILVQDSVDPDGRAFVDHVVKANTPLPVTEVADRFGTIVDGQETVRIRVYEQAGPTASEDVADNRLVLDGELTGVPPRTAGTVIRVTITLGSDGRLTVVAHEPGSGRELTLEAFIEGVIDAADAERLAALVGRTPVRE